MPSKLFHQLLPATEGNERLKFLTRFYLIDPLEVKIELELRHKEARGARTLSGNAEADVGTAENMAEPRGNWSRLGLDTWLTPEYGNTPTNVKYML